MLLQEIQSELVAREPRVDSLRDLGEEIKSSGQANTVNKQLGQLDSQIAEIKGRLQV